ncbi:MAG: hypothetical protein WBF58_14025 [Xanthobacteraceae bacterium]
MKTQILIASGILLAALGTTLLPIPAQAKTEKECAAEWKDMKAHNQTNGQKRKDFIAQCRGTSTSPSTPPTAAAPEPAPKTASPPPPAAVGNAVFPSGVSPKYSKESAGRARMHTCRDQYQENKKTGGNGGLKWIQKGGGYYSECNKRLKG